MNSNTGILKWPLIIAAVVVVLRVVLERAGAPETINNVLSVVVLHTLIVPVWVAVQLSRRKSDRPYATLFKLILLYVVLTRLMILPTYWAGRIFEWTQSRFDGLWGPDVGPIQGFVAVPLVTAAIWICASMVIGGALGSIILAATTSRRSSTTTP